MTRFPHLRQLALSFAFLGAVASGLAGCRRAEATAAVDPADTPSSPSDPVTHLAIGPEVLHTGVRRLGINLGGQNFYDSGQILRNLTFRNPGFEGEEWHSILRCKSLSGNVCTDDNQYAVWPAGFLDGAHYEIITGAAKGTAGTIEASTGADGGHGVSFTLAGALTHFAAGDFVLVGMDKPGQAQTGWWTGANGGATFATELKDLPPATAGRQALLINAAGAGQTASVSSYFDSLEGRSFLQLRGTYTVRFRARSVAGARSISVKVERLDQVHGRHSFLDQQVSLSPSWRDYTLNFKASEDGSAVGSLGLTLGFAGSSVLLDDVSLIESASAQNPTAFRDAVVTALRELHPGVLRYMDSGTDFGSSLDNMLAVPFARQRSGASTQSTTREDVPLGLHEFLVLAQAVGAEPWYSMPAGTTPAEARSLVEYLSGPVSTRYGRLRASLGQAAPWTSVFPAIHLELGNEEWNTRSFAGSTMADPKAYGERASDVFSAMRTAPGFNAASFDLILGGWASVPWWTGEELKAGTQQDSIAMAPYLFTDFNTAFSAEEIFGPMFAQPEQIDSRASGYMAQQLKAIQLAAHPTRLAVYEVNLGTMTGAATQADLDRALPSMGAGLAVADHMLLMLRDLGVNLDCLFSLTGLRNDFASTEPPKKTMPLWGVAVDMGGPGDLRRPAYLTLRAANEAILPTMLATHVTGANPAWNQALSPNDKIQLDHAHLIQSFAFSNGAERSLILLNLSRDQALPVDFSGPGSPMGAVVETVVTSAAIDDNNERQSKVVTREATRQLNVGSPYRLPPFSMTVLRWRTNR